MNVQAGIPLFAIVCGSVTFCAGMRGPRVDLPLPIEPEGKSGCMATADGGKICPCACENFCYTDVDGHTKTTLKPCAEKSE